MELYKWLPKVKRMGLIFFMVTLFAFPLESLQAVQGEVAYKMTSNQLQEKFYKTKIDKKITVNIQEASIEDALRQIANETGLKLTYRGDIIIEEKMITLRREISVTDAINFVLEGTDLDYLFSEEGYLLIYTSRDDLTDIEVQQNISGTVTDAETGESLPGVNIVVQGTTTGTSTNVNGQFELTVPSLDETLVFSYVGYQQMEVPINGQTTLEVALQSQAITGDELVVVGYGTQRVRDLTGSISSVSAREIDQVPAATVNQVLQGRSSGVMVTQGSGEPGQDARVRIRGFNSLQGDNAPLYVIDGVIDANINTVNPTNIESISVLKDAAAASIYGSRGANGVIIVQTNQGIRQQDLQIEVEHFTGIDVPGRTLPMMNSHEYMEFSNEAAQNNNNPIPYSDINGVLSQEGNGFNWQDALFEPGVRNRTNLAISGGTEKVTYFFSGAYEDHTAVIPKLGFERFNTRARLEVFPTDKLTLRGNISYVESQRDRSWLAFTDRIGTVGRSGVVGRTIFNPPILNPYNEDGTRKSLMVDSYNQTGSQQYSNGLIMVDESRILINNDLHLTFEGQYDLLENLNYKVSYSTSPSLSESKHFRPSYVPGMFGELENTGSRSFSRSRNQTIENIITYTETYQNHNVTGLVGTTYQTQKFEIFEGGASRFPFDSFELNNLGTGEIDTRSVSSGYSETTWLGYFGRIDYEYDDKYLVQVNARYDGSSVFRPGNRWGFFPSAAVGWVVTGENFMQDSGIDFLKLRTSYGSIGSNATGPYTTLPRVAVSFPDEYSFGNQEVQNFVMSLANPDLKWETTTQFNVGVDLGLLEERLNFTVDYYHKKTTDLILSRLTSIVNAPERNHSPSILSNLGSMRNSGVEFSVDYNHSFNNGMSWNVNFNISYQENEILDLALPEGQTFFTYGANVNRNYSRIEIGESLGNYNGFLTDGLFQSQAEIDGSAQPDAQPGDIRFVDTNGDGVINEGDWTVTGNAYPDYFGGLSSSFYYKGFEVDLVLSGAFGHEMANAQKLTTTYDLASTEWNKSRDVVDGRWTGQGTSNDIPRAGYSVPQLSDGINATNDFYIEDASYVKLRNLRLAYNIQNLLGASNIRFYIQGQNLFVITNYSGYDPESDNFANNKQNGDDLMLGLSWFTYPFTRSYSMGVNISF